MYTPFYNGDISQTELYLEATDALQSVIDEYIAVSLAHIIGDLNVRLPSEQMRHKNWYKKGGYNRHSNILYHFINDNGLNVTDISSKQDVNYAYFRDTTAKYTWIDHCLSTSHVTVFDCKILPRYADNVATTCPFDCRLVLCNRSQSIEHTVNTMSSFNGDVMQALPDSSHDQTCDKNIVDTYYLDNCQNREVHTIDAEQVNQFIMRLKSGKSPGLDDIYHEHLIFGNSEVLIYAHH